MKGALAVLMSDLDREQPPIIHDNMPLVTVVIPAYNHERYVVESIKSIINQTYRNIELIIINDGSKDRTHENILTLVEECKRRFVRFEYINRENVGLSATLNQALSMARGTYFSPLASDDIALPGKFALLVNALEEAGPKYAAAFGNALFIDGQGRRIGFDNKYCIHGAGHSDTYDTFMDLYTKGRAIDYKGEQFGTYQTLVAGNYLPAMSNLTRTASIAEVLGWTPGNLVEDWEMWLKLARTYKLLYVDEPVAFYRNHGLNSINTQTLDHVYASALLLQREKQYCIKRGFYSIWARSYNPCACRILRERHLSFTKTLLLFMNLDVMLLAKSVKRVIAQKLGMLRSPVY
jgi:alpha-1,3-rhamnosyltransferase